jgi:hypothetical protein
MKDKNSVAVVSMDNNWPVEAVVQGNKEIRHYDKSLKSNVPVIVAST